MLNFGKIGYNRGIKNETLFFYTDIRVTGRALAGEDRFCDFVIRYRDACSTGLYFYTHGYVGRADQMAGLFSGLVERPVPADRRQPMEVFQIYETVPPLALFPIRENAGQVHFQDRDIHDHHYFRGAGRLRHDSLQRRTVSAYRGGGPAGLHGDDQLPGESERVRRERSKTVDGYN